MPSGRSLPRRTLGSNRGTGGRSVGGRSSNALGQTVREQMASNPKWQHATIDGRWICPYCLTAVRGPQGSRQGLLRAVERHLSSRCPSYAGGQGAYQDDPSIQRARAVEDIAHRAMTDPAWQVFDHEGFWYSPASLQRIPSVRIQGGRFDGFVVRRMAEHMVDCPYYRQGYIHEVGAVQQARDRGVRIDRMAGDIRRLLSHQIWRYIDQNHNWVCPYCLDHVQEVQVNDPSDWAHMAPFMAVHLLEHCSQFTPEQQVLKSEDEVMAAAGSLPAASSATDANPIAEPIPAPVVDEAPTEETNMTKAMPSVVELSPPVAKPIQTGTDAPVAGEQTLLDRLTEVAEQTNSLPTSTNASAETASSSPSGELGSGQIDAEAALAGGLLDQLMDEVEGPVLTGDEDIPTAQVIEPDTTDVGALNDTNDGDSTMTSALDAFFDESGTNESLKTRGPDTTAALAWMDSKTPHPSVTASTHAEDLDRARDVQQGMLREAPKLPGYTFGTRFDSCDAVSGDFYEFIALGDGRIGFAQGDVSGHGIQAGLIMSMAKKVLAIYARQGDSPARVLSAVNDALVDDLGGRMFVTITYAILDPAARTVTWARAGHNPSIIYNRATGSLTEVRPAGMVVGMKSGPLFAKTITEEVTELRSGDLVVVYTDGLTETMNRQQEEYGTDRLFEAIKDHSDSDMETMLDRLMDSVRSFRASSEAQDDVTLLALSVD